MAVVGCSVVGFAVVGCCVVGSAVVAVQVLLVLLFVVEVLALLLLSAELLARLLLVDWANIDSLQKKASKSYVINVDCAPSETWKKRLFSIK